ncbi:MAG: hypothetical protein GTN70_02590 [Deltaproteobacteria bacterium]|nr:hypothetical protein [Deltaproteobacteria bacterium]NIS76533.1 hypothetical protein [Deltaproteobacteria bacterium]
MKKTTIGLVLVSFIVCVALAWAGTKKGAEEKMAELPKAEGAAVYTFITTASKYQDWPLWPGKEKMYKGQPPHGAFLTTYINDAAKSAIDAGTVMGAGAMIVKENYSPEKQLAAVTVMYKVAGFNPEANDWFWAKYKADGTVEKEGKVEGCIKCHAAKKANDYVFTGEFVK